MEYLEELFDSDYGYILTQPLSLFGRDNKTNLELCSRNRLAGFDLNWNGLWRATKPTRLGILNFKTDFNKTGFLRIYEVLTTLLRSSHN